jgi:hypothetical protein
MHQEGDAMWRSVFLHEFPDLGIRSFQALPGAVSTATQGFLLEPDAASGGFALPLLAGGMFEFTPAKTLREIIGVSMRIRLKGSTAGFVSSALFRLSAGVDLDLTIRRPRFSSSKPTNATVRAGAAGTEFAGALPTLDGYADLRLDWHTSGQARLFANGRLVAYHNAVAPGAVLEINRVAFGLPNPEPDEFNRLARRFTVARVFVRALARQDTLAAFARQLPKPEPTDDDLLQKCRLIAEGNILRTVDRLRAFMASAHQALTQPWTQPAGPAAGPFQQAAIDAHDLAVAAGDALYAMLRSGDYSHPEEFLDPFTEFLRILRATLPTQFIALATELSDVPVVPEECRLVMNDALDPHRAELEPLIDLLTAASARVKSIAKGKGHGRPTRTTPIRPRPRLRLDGTPDA